MISGNNSVLTKATDAKKANEQGTDADRVRLAAQAALIDGEGVINTTATSGKGSLYAALVEEFGSEKISASNYANGTVTLNGKQYTVTISGSVTQTDVTVSGGKQWALPEGDTTVNVGDLLTPTVTGLSNEKFYVIADDGTTLTLLAERCINTTSNTQESSYSAVEFDPGEWDEDSGHVCKPGTTTPVTNVYANSSIRGLVKDYVDTLTGLDLLDVEEVYGEAAVSERKGRLMWYEETQDATFKSATNYRNILHGPLTERKSYWLGGPNGTEGGYARYVESADGEEGENGDGTYLAWYAVEDNGGYFGLRPVIKILKSNV